MVINRDGLLRRISLLQSKIRTSLDFAHQKDEHSVKTFLALQKNVLEYLTEVEICVNKWQLKSSSEENSVDIEKESLIYSLRFRRELEDPEINFLPTATDSEMFFPLYFHMFFMQNNTLKFAN